MNILDIAQIVSLIDKDGGSIRFEVKAEDSQRFADTLVRQTIDKVMAEQKEKSPLTTEDRLLTGKETMSMLGVTFDTLMRLCREGHLKAIKVGRNVRYCLSNVQSILNQRNESDLGKFLPSQEK